MTNCAEHRFTQSMTIKAPIDLVYESVRRAFDPGTPGDRTPENFGTEATWNQWVSVGALDNPHKLVARTFTLRRVSTNVTRMTVETSVAAPAPSRIVERIVTARHLRAGKHQAERVAQANLHQGSTGLILGE